MSVRLKGFLATHAQSRLELSYADKSQMTELKDFPCEMTFTASDLFLEHESEQHHYLPYLHFVGQITELRGDFPYQVSSLYFGEGDNASLKRDVYYYPTPEELSHLILHGKLYSKDFEPSSILKGNTYSLPVKVDLSVLPPENEALYQGMLTTGATLQDMANTERANVPIIYAAIKGSGVDKENDSTISYYGLEFEDAFPQMVMTAESSGYTDPPLCSMDYWPDPDVKELMSEQDLSDYYISPEEEAELMRAKSEQQQVAEPTVDVPVQTLDAEERLLAQADRQIASRIAERRAQQKKDMAKTLQTEAETMPTPAVVREESKRLDAGFLSLDEDAPKAESKKLSEPDTRQQMAEVKMDLNPEENAYVEADREEAKDSKSEDVLEASDMDVRKLEGADVSDAEAQVKVNEANAADVARDVAVSDLQGKAEEKESVETRKTSVEVKQKHREVPERMQAVADAYDAQHQSMDSGYMELD